MSESRLSRRELAKVISKRVLRPFHRVLRDVRLGRHEWDATVPIVARLKLTREELAGLIAVERWLGKGDELVYAYSFPAYVSLAASSGSDRWPIKIGLSWSVSLGRIAQQVGTGTPEWPTVHPAIRCDDCLVVEKAIHNALKLSGHSIENAPGCG